LGAISCFLYSKHGSQKTGTKVKQVQIAQTVANRTLLSRITRSKFAMADDTEYGRISGMTPIDLLEPLQGRRSQLERLSDQVKALERRREELQRAIADHKVFQPEVEKDKIRGLDISATNTSRKIADQKVNTTNLDRRLQSANAAKVGPLVVWRYFTAEQKQIRSEASRLALNSSSAKQQLSKDQGTLSKIREDINAGRKLISYHENFDLNDSEQQLSSLGPEIERLKAAHATANAEMVRLETKIRPHTQELDRLKSELAAALLHKSTDDRSSPFPDRLIPGLR
jgi:chromosome segregation ATPase